MREISKKKDYKKMLRDKSWIENHKKKSKRNDRKLNIKKFLRCYSKKLHKIIQIWKTQLEKQ